MCICASGKSGKRSQAAIAATHPKGGSAQERASPHPLVREIGTAESRCKIGNAAEGSRAPKRRMSLFASKKSGYRGNSAKSATQSQGGRDQ